MVKKINFQISFTDKWFYTFVTMIVIVALAVGIYAFNTNDASSLGHSAGELNLSGGVSGDVVFNDNVGIGISSPSSELDVLGSIVADNITSLGFIRADEIYGDGSGLWNLKVRLRSQETCNSANDGLLRYMSGQCSGNGFMSSYFDVCVRTAVGTYTWKTLSTDRWGDSSCSTDGCEGTDEYFECDGLEAESGCFPSEPQWCDCGADPSCPSSPLNDPDCEIDSSNRECEPSEN